MLEFIDKKRAAGPLDRKVKIAAMTASMFWDELEDFERVFKEDLAKIKKVNHINPVFAYKLVRHDANTMEVWHVHPEELIHDRLLCAVEYAPNIFMMKK